jgi:hypothetical protein
MREYFPCNVALPNGELRPGEDVARPALRSLRAPRKIRAVAQRLNSVTSVYETDCSPPVPGDFDADLPECPGIESISTRLYEVTTETDAPR